MIGPSSLWIYEWINRSLIQDLINYWGFVFIYDSVIISSNVWMHACVCVYACADARKGIKCMCLYACTDARTRCQVHVSMCMERYQEGCQVFSLTILWQTRSLTQSFTNLGLVFSWLSLKPASSKEPPISSFLGPGFTPACLATWRFRWVLISELQSLGIKYTDS